MAAKSKTTYSEKLNDPRWQQLRLLVMSRDKWTCQRCQDTKETLHVHHLNYSKTALGPWDYPESELVTLCATCHKEVEEEKAGIQFFSSRMHFEAYSHVYSLLQTICQWDVGEYLIFLDSITDLANEQRRRIANPHYAMQLGIYPSPPKQAAHHSRYKIEFRIPTSSAHMNGTDWQAFQSNGESVEFETEDKAVRYLRSAAFRTRDTPIQMRIVRVSSTVVTEVNPLR